MKASLASLVYRRQRITFIFACLFAISSAQYIQEYTWNNINGVNSPYWRRENADTPHPVVIPSVVTVLEYNCFYMRAICLNAQRWLNTPRAQGRSMLQYTAGGANLFSYDLKESAKDRRGTLMCPGSWKDSHTCPETNQPPVMPGPWFSTARETADSLQVNEIAARYGPDPDDPTQQIIVKRSGRYYTCEEFPARSWVEGGVGTYGQNISPEGDGAAGLTYCAPMMINKQCTQGLVPGDEDESDAIWSEQNWQGQTHARLAAVLRARGAEHLGRAIDEDSEVVIFALVMINSPNNNVPARVVYNGAIPYTWNVPINRGTKKRDDDSTSPLLPIDILTYMANLTAEDIEHWPGVSVSITQNDTTIINSNTTSFSPSFESFANPTFFVTNDSVIPETPESMLPYLDNQSNNTQSVNLVNNSITAQITPQEPDRSKIDILAIGKEYILAQIATSSNATLSNTTIGLNSSKPLKSSVRRRVSHAETSLTLNPINSLQKRGPVTCSATQECVDGSCCGKDGLCGFKDVHCGAGCQSNCNATAMCGIDSVDGKTSCGLKLCCSFYGWCGTESVHCYDPEPQFGKTPCQQGFGSCEIKASPSCSPDSGTASGRRIAYYQGWNVRERLCDRVTPAQINTRGLTHLFYAFATFDPATFEITPMNTQDIPIYGQFTALKRNGLQTWIAVGGWSFNDPGPTEQAYSNMVSTATNRAKFITSLMAFMTRYGFQGADIDWEYPAEVKRGGRKEDVDNLTLLMKEMRAAFGGNFGLSLTLAPDYWYLRGFKPAEIQNHVDFMGFMSYDLHGPWDTDVKALGSIVRPHTDATEIDKNLVPLWFDGVDPSKVNMGIAYYGRTYKLSDPSCGSMGCGFSGPGNAGSCTGFAGVLSNREIRRMISEQGYKPYLNGTAMIKYFTYDTNNWVGYDDEETFALKERLANSRCLGGMMIWSIDFDATIGGGGGTNNYTSPESATIIPMSHTTVPARSTYTVNAPASTDISSLRNDGNQNSPQGPGYQGCASCSFFRLITSTCCGFGGSVGNPILIPANVPVPMNIPLPAGFVPSQPFISSDGRSIPANSPLTTETNIPRGTVFPNDFVIPAGQPLKNGENDDSASGNSSLVWINPSIWEEQDPTVWCLWPCTLVLPPWTKTTTTIDYPIITVTDSSWKTTITRPPITISSWYLSTVVVENTKQNDDTTRISKPTPLTTSTWPPVTYTDKSGKPQTTRPPGPRPPPPPPGISLPALTIRIGPPKPTAPPGIRWPDPCCPPPGGENNKESEEQKEEEKNNEEEDPSPTCNIRDIPNDPDPTGNVPTGGNGGSTTRPGTNPHPTTTRPGSNPTTSLPPVISLPDFTQNKVQCYNVGQTANRDKLLQAVSSFCGTEGYQGMWQNGIYNTLVMSFGWDDSEDAGIDVIVTIEMKANCQWLFNKDKCMELFGKPIDDCQTDTRTKKQGATMENNCMKFRVDPNVNNAPKPVPPPPPPAPPAPPPRKPTNSNAQYEIFGQVSSSSGGGMTQWYHSVWGYASTSSYDPCNVSAGWSKTVGSSSTPPNEITDVKGVFGDTCKYVSNGLNYDKAKQGDIVGVLQCPSYDNARCAKDKGDWNFNSCFGGVTEFHLLACVW